LLAMVVVYFLITKSREGFAAEFVDHTNARITAENKHSSYAQRTNHSVPVPGPDVPIQGSQSPFRVNMVQAFIP
jgi:hypothetical protein